MYLVGLGVHTTGLPGSILPEGDHALEVQAAFHQLASVTQASGARTILPDFETLLTGVGLVGRDDEELELAWRRGGGHGAGMGAGIDAEAGERGSDGLTGR